MKGIKSTWEHSLLWKIHALKSTKLQTTKAQPGMDAFELSGLLLRSQIIFLGSPKKISYSRCHDSNTNCFASGRDDRCCFCNCAKFLFEDEVWWKGSGRFFFATTRGTRNPEFPLSRGIHIGSHEASQKLAEEYLDWLKREVLGKEVAIESSMMMLGADTRWWCRPEVSKMSSIQTHIACISYEVQVATDVQLHWMNLSKAVQIAVCRYLFLCRSRPSRHAYILPSIHQSIHCIQPFACFIPWIYATVIMQRNTWF